MKLEKYSNLVKGDRLHVVTNQGTDWQGVYFESQTENTITIYEYIHDKNIVIDKHSIVELYNETQKLAIPLIPLSKNVPSEKFSLFEFVNIEHEANYELLLKKWEQGLKNKEYASAMYILALPIIFDKFKESYVSFETPVTWIVDYEYKYNDNTATLYGLTQSERDNIIINYDLTSSMVHLGRLALHLWNSYGEFHLLDCLSTLDSVHYFAFTQAILIRK